jgi:hypothetical protein
MFVLQDTCVAIGNLKGSILSQMITNN